MIYVYRLVFQSITYNLISSWVLFLPIAVLDMKDGQWIYLFFLYIFFEYNIWSFPCWVYTKNTTMIWSLTFPHSLKCLNMQSLAYWTVLVDCWARLVEVDYWRLTLEGYSLALLLPYTVCFLLSQDMRSLGHSLLLPWILLYVPCCDELKLGCTRRSLHGFPFLYLTSSHGHTRIPSTCANVDSRFQTLVFTYAASTFVTLLSHFRSPQVQFYILLKTIRKCHLCEFLCMCTDAQLCVRDKN